MSSWEEPGHDKEITDLDTARLALRGALSSARSLQDLNGKLKGELQEFLHREKALNERLIRLQTELNDSYSRLDKEITSDRERADALRDTLREEIVAEQNHKWQSEIDALRQSVQNWTEVRRQKETELKILKDTLLTKEQEVFTLQKEKIAAEEKAHRDVLEAIKRSREGVSAAIDDVILSKDKEIGDLQRKLAAQPKVIEERMQQIEQELHRKEQSLLLQFRDRQHALEFDWARREKELWEKATESREALERDLKSQWEDRKANLEENLEKRRLTLETQFKQQDADQHLRLKTRDEELHQTWAAKELGLAQQWAERENELAREFQKTLDLERQRASDELVKLKAETEDWRKGQADSLRRKEDEFNKAHEGTEQQLRSAYRKKEEELLARHQEILDAAQRQISDLMTRTTEKEGVAKAAQDRLAAVLKERQDIADKMDRLEADTARRNAELETLIKTRDEELARLNKDTTTRDESRVAALQNLERDQLQKESELKVVREKIQQAESDRKAALEHAADLETEFTQRQQQMETAFRAETETLSGRLTALSQESAERQQTDQRLLAELSATVQQRTSEVAGLTHQLQLTRHDIEKMTQESGEKQIKHVMIRRQLEERLGEREAELNRQIDTLEKERMSIEERFEARVIELEQELARRLSEDRSLQERFAQSEKFRADLEQQAEMLRDRLAAHEKQAFAREDETRMAREAAELERISAEQKLQLRIGELEAAIARQATFSTELQERLQRSENERAADQNAFEIRETRLQERTKALQQQLTAQADEIHARLQSVQLEHDRIENALRTQLKDQDAAHMKLREQLLGQVAELEGQLRRKELEVKGLKDQMIQDERTHRDYVRDANQREAALEERTQFLQKTLDVETAELQSKFELADRAHMKAQDALRGQVLELETALNRKTAEANDLKARLIQAHERQAELQQTTAQLEARVMDREQAVRAAAQTHLQSEQKLEGALTDMQAAFEKRNVEFQAGEKRLAELSKERQAEARAAAEREKQLEERLQAVDEKLRTQKEQITLRLTGVERQRLQSEEALHTRTLDLEQRLAEKSGLVKTLQDQLARAGSEQEHLGKKIVTLESHLARTEQQLKGRETEYQTLLSTAQKDTAATHDAHQRKLLELQGQRLKLESDLKGLQDLLTAAEQEKHQLTEKMSILEAELVRHTEESRGQQSQTQKEMAERLAADVKAAEALMIRITALESQLMRKESAFVALEKELAQSRGDYDQLSSTAIADHQRLTAQQALLESQLRELAVEQQKRLDAVLQERLLVEKEHQRKILELDEMLAGRTRALEALDNRLASSEGQRADRDRQATELHKEIKALELSYAAQQEEFRARMAGFEKERAQLQETQSNRITHLESQLTHRESALRALQEKLTQTDADRKTQAEKAQALEAELVLQKKDWEARMEGLLVDRSKTETALHARVVNLQETLSIREKDLAMLKETLQQTEQAHALMDSSTEKAVSMSAKERQALEERLVAEVGRVRDLESQLRAHAAHIKEAELALVAGEKERSALHAALTELRTRLDDEIGVRDAMAQDQVNALQGKMLTLETEWRTRLDETSKAASARVESLQGKIVELEGALGVRENDLSSLRQQIEEAGLERDRLADVIVQKDRNHQTLAELAERDKKEFAARLALVHAERNAAEEALQAQLKALRTSLERQLSAEQQRSQGFETQVAAQLSELKQLRDLLSELQSERANLLETLAQERAKATADNKEFNGRLTAAAQDAEQRLSAIQARASDLEKALALQRSEHEQRTAILKADHVKSEDALQLKMTQEFNARLAALQTGHSQAEKDLHARLLELRDTLASRVADVQRLEIALRDTEQQRAALDHYSTASHAESTKQREALEQHLADERARAQALDTQCVAQISELKQLQTALQDVRAEREELLKVLAAEREKASSELKGREKATSEMESALRTRYEAQIKDAAARFDALQARALDLERKASDKQASIDRLQETLKEIDGRRAHAEAQWARETQERTQSQERLAAEYARAQALETQYTAQISELKQLQTALQDIRVEREELLNVLSAEREKASSELKGRQKAMTEMESALRIRFETQIKEGAARFEALQARALELERKASDKQAAVDRLQETLKELDGRRAHAEAQWAEEAQSRRQLQDAAAKAQEEFTQRIQALQSGHQAAEEDLHQRLLTLRSELEQRLNGEREQSHALDTQLAAQVSELKQLRVSLAESRAERDALLAALSAEREKIPMQDKEFRKTLAAAEADAVKRMQALQARTQDLEKALGLQKSEYEQRLALQLAAIQTERKAAEDELHKRLLELRDTLAARGADIQKLGLQLKETEQARAALDQFSMAAHTDSTQRRESLERQLQAERERAQDLDTQLTTQISELKQLQAAFEDARAEREQLIAALEAERARAAAALKAQENTTVEREAAVRSQMEAQEKEFRARLAAMDTEAARRLSVLQARTAELEKTLAAQRTEFEHRFALSQGERAKSEKALQTRISELYGQWVARSAELDAVQQALATVQKERDALSAATGDQKQSYAQQLETLRQRSLTLEHEASEAKAAMTRMKDALTELESHKAHAEAQWAAEARERRAAQDAAAKAQDDFTQRLAAIQTEHQTAENGLHERLIEVRADLDQRLNAERDKNQSLSTQLSAQVSELLQLRTSLEEARAEREKLLSALAAEREKTTLELKDRESLTSEQKRKYEQRLNAQEKEFRERLAAADAEAARRFVALQARTSELERALAAQHSESEQQMAAQRSEYEQRLAVLEAERGKGEKSLQSTLSDLQIQLAQRGKELQGVQDRLMIVDAQRREWETSAASLGSDHSQERKNFEMRLSEERARAAALDLALKNQAAEYADVQDALAASRKEGKVLSTRVGALEKDMRERLQAAALDASTRMAALQTRAVELERQGAEKQAALDRLHESLAELESKRAHLEEQWTAEVKERRALQDAAAQAHAQFTARLDAVQAERATAEQALYAQLLELRDMLTTRAAAIQVLERQLKETEQARAALEHYSTASHTEMTQAQSALAQQFHAEQDRAKVLDNRLSAQVAELKQLRQATLDARAEREQLLGQLAAEREKAALALKTHEKASSDEAVAYRQKADALDKEFRERLAAANMETTRRLTLMQTRATELEKTLTVQRAEHEQRMATLQAERIKTEKALQTKISEVQGQLITSEAELAGTRQQLAALQRDHDSALKSSDEQKLALNQRLAALQDQARGLERQVSERQTQLDRLTEALAQMDAKRAYAEEQWAVETQERRAAQATSAREKDEWTKRMAAALDERKAAEEVLHRRLGELRDALSARGTDLQNLEQRLLEADQARAAIQQSAAVSQADTFRQKQELEQRLSEERGRVRDLDLALKANAALIKDLKDALAGEQKQYKASNERNVAYEQRMEDLRARAADLKRQGVEKQSALEHLRETLAELEAKRSQAERQRDDLANRLSAVQAERKTAEDALHQRLLELRDQLEHRVMEEQTRARGLDTQLAGQVAELKSLRGALADEKTERERLANALAGEREKALLELKGREKASAETTSTLWQQMQAQEKEFRAQLASIEEDSSRRVGILQTRTVELEKSLATQRADFEQRLAALQQERAGAEEKLHAKIFSLEETLSRRIAEAQTLHAEFAAVETARSVAEESSSAAHGELVRQQALFDERLSQEQSQARAIEQQLQQYKSQAREWKDALTAAKEERKALETAWAAEKQKIQDDARSQGLTLKDAREQQERQLAALNQDWSARLDTLSKESADRLKALQSRLNEMDRQLAQRGLEAGELKENVAALEEERVHLQAAVAREEEAKQAAIDRGAVLEERLGEAQRTHLQAEQKMHARLVDLEDQLSRKSAALNQVDDRLELLQKGNDEFEKSSLRDGAAWNRQREDLEKKLSVERGRLRELEADQTAQKASLRELQEALGAAEKERQNASDALKAQKERFLSDLALRDAGSSQSKRALELEREALEKQWQERLKSAAQDTVERMEGLRRRAEDLEKQLSGRNSELHELHDQVGTLEQARRNLQEKIDILNRDRKEQADAAAAERARLVERSRALEERLKEQANTLSVQMDTFERERGKIEETLEHRLAQLQDQVAKRTADLKDAQERLHLVEESRAELEKTAGQGHSQWSRERAQLEERLATERSHAKELARQLAETTTQAKDVKESLSDAERERRLQMQTLAADKKALQARIEELEAGLSAAPAADPRQIEKIEADWARRLDAAEQRHATEIEKRVAEKLREQMMGALESGALKSGDSAAMQTLLEEWVFGFAHQVRNPLGIIRSVAESLYEGEARRSQKDSLSAIVKAVDGLNLRLKEFIEFSKPVKPLMQSVDVPSAVAAAVRFVEEKGLPANTSIETLLPAPGTRVWMDPDHLRTILVHLLRNASEAMPKGGHIRLDVVFEPKLDRLELRVRDEGAGIPREHLKEVGRPFFSTKPGAVGLGLALIKRLLRAYDGKLEIESKSGHATTVICRMKTRQESAGQWAA